MLKFAFASTMGADLEPDTATTDVDPDLVFLRKLAWSERALQFKSHYSLEVGPCFCLGPPDIPSKMLWNRALPKEILTAHGVSANADGRLHRYSTG